MGQVWTTVWQMKHQKVSMSMDRKLKFWDSLARYMFNRSNLECSLTVKTKGASHILTDTQGTSKCILSAFKCLKALSPISRVTSL